MIHVTFPDGSLREYAPGTTGAEIAAQISKSLSKKAVAMALDGVLSDLNDPIVTDARLDHPTTELPIHEVGDVGRPLEASPPEDPLGEREARLVIEEGRYHQVRRMFAAVGNHVTALHRDRIGGLSLPDDLAVGDYRVLPAETAELVFAD